MNPDPPFTAPDDEPIEARIVSWVLGEASAFETAELERLCEERPELLVFRQRIREIHGLLEEGERPVAPDMWKLPPEKRRAIEELFGDEGADRPDVPEKPRHVRRVLGGLLLAAAACVALLLVVERFHPFQQEGRVVLEVVPNIPGTDSFRNGSAGADIHTPLFLRNEIGKIRGDQVLKQVVERLGLEEKWNLDEQAAVERVRGKLKVDRLKDSALIEIRARDKDARDAKHIAHAVAVAYRDHRDELERRDSERALAELNKAVRNQEDKVEDRRKVLTTIARTKRIIYKGSDSQFGNSGADEDTAARDSLHKFYETEQEKMQLESQISSLLKYDADQLMVYAAGLDLPDNAVRTTYPKYLEEKRMAESLRIEGMGENHPSVQAANEKVEALKRTLDEGVVNLRATLQAQLDLTNERLAGIEIAKNDDIEESIKRGLDAQDYVDAKRDFETDQELLQNLKLKLIGQTVASNMPRESVVIHEDSFVEDGDGDSAMVLASNGTPGSPAPAEAQAVMRSGPAPEYAAETRDLEVRTETAARPSTAPASAAAKVIASPADVPETELLAGARFADAESFGTGWGSADDTAEAGPLLDHLAGGAGLYEYRSDTASHRERFSLADAIPQRGDAPMDPGNTAGRPVSRLAQRQEPLVDSSETSASEDPYSTFSLNVGDASFQIAKAALARGERPDPAAVKPEQFYNAVDYQDPAPEAGEAVAMHIEQCAHPFIPGRNLVRVAIKTAAEGRGASQPLRLTLLVDHSGSMVRDDRRAAMERALTGLSTLLTESDRVTVVGFSRTPRLLADSLTGDKVGNLANLIHLESSEGGTNLEEALALGERLALRSKLEGARNRIVLFTDGAANLGNADPAKLAARIKAMRRQGLAFDIAGIAADDLNDGLLAELARNGDGRYHVVGKGVDGAVFAKRLAGSFRPAAENVKVQVRFHPERVGRYRLVGFEKDRLRTEDFRNDAVDAAELAAEEAGVAVYQVEVLPHGNGAIGEVGVRFRDTSADAMVERTMTISHDPNAPAFDRASPSMQLAGLAVLAAEKLRGGAAAAAIDFRKLSQVRAEVKNAYAGSARVAELLEMIGSL